MARKGRAPNDSGADSAVRRAPRNIRFPICQRLLALKSLLAPIKTKGDQSKGKRHN